MVSFIKLKKISDNEGRHCKDVDRMKGINLGDEQTTNWSCNLNVVWWGRLKRKNNFSTCKRNTLSSEREFHTVTSFSI